MTNAEDRTLRAENGNAFLDADGDPIVELSLDGADALDEQSATVAELAFGKRSWRFGHVIVDEAQDLTQMQWRMVARRARSGSMTIVGDLAQRSVGPPGTWADHVPSSLGNFSYRELTINYRAPEETNRLAASILARLAPGLSAGQSIRSVGRKPVAIKVESATDALGKIADTESSAVPDGKVAVIAAPGRVADLVAGPGEGCLSKHVAVLHPWQCKGLEFDSVIVVEPAEIVAMKNGLSLLYVAVTRSTNRLTIIHESDLPAVIREGLASESGDSS